MLQHDNGLWTIAGFCFSNEQALLPRLIFLLAKFSIVFFLALPHMVASAQTPPVKKLTKTDIRTFYVGMSLPDFEQRLQEIGCNPRFLAIEVSTDISCNVADGLFIFKVTKNLSTNVLFDAKGPV